MMTDARNEIVPFALPAPGWYPDPADASMTRWWSGEGWTDYVAPLTPAPASATPMAEIEAPVTAVRDDETAPEPAPESETAPAPETDPIGEFFLPADAEPAPAAPFTPDLSVTPESAAARQQEWHARSSRVSATPKRGEVPLTATPRVSSRRPASDYQPNWIAGLAFFLAVVSIPIVAIRVLWELHPLTASIAAGAPISIALLALVTSARRGGRGILLSIVAVVLSAATLAAGLLLPRDIVQAAADLVLGYLNIS